MVFVRTFIQRMAVIVFFITGTGWPAFCQDIRDVKGPVDFPANYFLLYLLLGIVLVVVVFFLVRFVLRRRRTKREQSLPIKPFYVVAYERLEDLKAKDLPSKGLIKEYYIELSGIVRRYIEDRFNIKAPDMTTQEFLWFLRDSDSLSDELKDLLKAFLTSCDLVKFAKYGPTRQEMDHSFSSAKKFIDATVPKEEPKE